MAAAHQAFARHPNNFRGVLTCDTFSPLTLEGVEVQITSQNLAARVTLRCEYKNYTGQAQDVFAAFTLAPSWELSSIRCESGKHFTVSNLAKVDKHELLKYADETFVPSVVTQVISWPVLNLESVIISATFFVPITLSASQSELLVHLPKSIFPSRVEPSDTKADFGSYFIIPAPAKLPHAIFVGAKGTVNGIVEKAPTIQGTKTGAKFQGSIGADKKSYNLRYEDTEKSLAVREDLVIVIPVSVDAKEPLHVAVARETSDLVDQANRFAIETTFSPVLASANPVADNSEVVFVVDASESMRPFAAQVRRSLRIAIAGLPAGVFFNVLRFGAATTDWLFPKGSEEISEANRDSTLNDYVPNLRFELSGCSLYSAIRSVYETPFITGFVRNIVLITDGGDTKFGPRIVEIARANTHSSRLSVIALGADAHVNQLSLASTYSSGQFHHIASPNDKDGVAAAVVSTLNAVVVPTLTHVSLRFQAADGSDELPAIRPCASLLPVVPSGGRLVTYGLADEGLKDFTAILTGLIGGSHCEYKYSCSKVRDAPASHQSDDALTVSLPHQAAANARIRGLIDFHVRSTVSDEEGKEVASLSANFFLPSPVTRYVARGEAGKIGAGGVYAGYVASKLYYNVSLRPTRDASGLACNPDESHHLASQAEKSRLAGLSNVEYFSVIVNKIVSTVCSTIPDAEDLLVAQKADGSFSPSSARFLAAVGISEEFFTSRKPSWADDETWATALGIVAAEKLEGSCGLLALRKAKDYVASKNGTETVNAARRTLM